MVIVNFQAELIEMTSSYDEDVNEDSGGLTHIIIKEGTWTELKNNNKRNSKMTESNHE